jgi:hypothetical protein
MAAVKVPTTQIAELLGLDPSTDEVTVRRALSEWIARNDAKQPAAAARHDDERIVAAAISAGKFTPARREFYLNALREDPAGARRVIAVLAAVPQAFTGQPAFDPEIERVSAITTGRPYEPAPAPQAAVQAAAAQSAPAQRGTDPVTSMQELNAQIEADPAMHRLSWAVGGPGGGLKPPPEQFTSYPEFDPSWNPKPRLVDHGDGTSSWETPPADFTMGTGIPTPEADLLARDLASTYNIDLGTVKGTGARGRIKSSDVVEAARRAGRL